MRCSLTAGGNEEAEEFLPLIMISWDLAEHRPTVAFSRDPWDRLSAEEEGLVFGQLCSLALDFAPLAIPDGLRAGDWGSE